MASNEDRREAARRKLDEQLRVRAEQTRRRRLLAFGGSLAALAAATAVIVGLVVSGGPGDSTDAQAAPESTVAPSGPANPAEPPPRGGEGQLPAFAAPQGLGGDCRYLETGEAAREVALPRSGRVPTEEAQVSVSMSTNQGNIGLVLNNAEAPCTVNSFASLAQRGYFDDTICHRLTTAPALGVLQCGDPGGTGTGGPGYRFANEYPTNQYAAGDPALQSPVLYPRGTLAMANAGPDTNGSQFFLVYQDSQLPPNYTVFGSIDATGLTTLDKIAAAGVAGGGTDGAPAEKVEVSSILLD